MSSIYTDVDTSSRRARKKLETQVRIVDTAMALFDQQGFEQTTMEQIADDVDIAKATLYRYFPTKEAIIAAFWQQRSKKLQKNITHFIAKYKNTHKRLKACLEDGMREIMKSRELYDVYLRYRMQNICDPEINAKLRSGSQEIFMEIINAGQQVGEIREDVPAKILAGQLELMFVMLATSWLMAPKEFVLDSSIALIVDLFLHGAINNAK